MPLYEYQCRKCQQVFEALIRSGKDTADLSCPHCRDRKVNKLFSTFATNSDQRGGLSVPASSSKSGCSSCSRGSCTTCK
ncbi:MAG: zinc ribbon domain-containing protein [Planctomycetes bacterium]|nr:zinc ribbon domain-containing protein [Planctomycetota bacterium]